MRAQTPAIHSAISGALRKGFARSFWFSVAGPAGIAVCAYCATARAEPPRTADESTVEGELPNVALSPTVPPPLNTPYLQYGIAFTAEFVTSAGGICANVDDPCILGGGGGITARVGRRSAGPWYFGGAYELTKQDPHELYRLATLQQLRGEARYYVTTGRDTQPYAAFGAGLAGYGNEMGFDTWGPSVFTAIGVETQLSRRTVIGLAVAYRVMRFARFTDSSGAERDAGYAQFFGIDLTLEGRDPL
jgi:hypothetical protein